MWGATRFAESAFRSPGFQFGADAVERTRGFIALKSALPDDYQVPTGIAPHRFVAVVALDVLRPFLHPEGDIRLRHCRIFAPVSVPKATSHINYRFGLGDNNVWSALKTPVAHSIPPTRSEQPFADKDLRQSVFAANLRHQPAALFCRYAIHALQPSSGQCSDFFGLAPARYRKHPIFSS